MGIFDRLRGRDARERAREGQGAGSAARAPGTGGGFNEGAVGGAGGAPRGTSGAGDAAAAVTAGAAGAAGRIHDGVWPGVAPAGLPPSVDVDRPGPSFAVNARELAGVRGMDALQARVTSPDAEPAARGFLALVVAIAADLKRRGAEVTELLVPEPASPWSAFPFVPVVVRPPGAAEPREVPVLVNPVPVTERELLAFLVFAGRVRRAPRFHQSPVAVYGPQPLPASFARLADAELPGLLEADLAPVLATRTPTPAEGARAFAEAVARRSKLHLDGSPESLERLEGVLGRHAGERYGSVARVGLAAYVGQVASARAGARWEGKLPLGRLHLATGESLAPLTLARELLPASEPPRLALFLARAKGGAIGAE